MDLFKKFLGIDSDDDDKKKKTNKDEFRKPAWFEDFESDDDVFDGKNFNVRIFANPEQFHRHFEQQLEEIFKFFDENADDPQNFKTFEEEFFKQRPGIREQFEGYRRGKKGEDTDLDGKILPGHVKIFLDQVNPQQNAQPTPTPPPQASKIVRTEEQQIMDMIHGTQPVETPTVRPKRRIVQPKIPNAGVPNGVFDGSSPRMFGQSIISHTIRRPDGSIETRRVVRDSEGHTKTTITRSQNGQTETITSYGDADAAVKSGGAEGSAHQPAIEAPKKAEEPASIVKLDQNLYTNREGYVMPRNIW